MSRTERLLERQNRLLKFALGLSLAMLAAGGLAWWAAATPATAAGSGDPLAVLKVQKLQIVDAAGKVRAILGMDDPRRVGLILLDENNRPRLRILCQTDVTAVTTNDAAGNLNTLIGTYETTGPVLTFGKNGGVDLSLAPTADNSGLVLTGKAGTVVLGSSAAMAKP